METGTTSHYNEETPLVALVVDDDADINRLFQLRLKAAGLEVRSAPDGETALAMIEDAQPDLMVLDVSMPGMSGLEVLTAIRERHLDIAVIMTTAFGSETVAIEALRLGANDYLRKPFQSPELRAVVQRTVERLGLRRQNEALRKRLDAELMRASRIQARLLPNATPHVPGYELAARCVPASAVGGDFYDWRIIDGSTLAISLGDVMGKGMPASLLMATFRAALRPAMMINDPAEAARLVEEALRDDLDQTESFVTLFLGMLDVDRHVIRYVDAGHGLVMVLHSGGALEPLAAPGLPFGILPDAEFELHEHYLEEGDTLLIYSDGLQDALGDGDVAPGRISSIIQEHATCDAAVDALVDAARSAGPLPDDVTIILARRRPGLQA